MARREDVKIKSKMTVMMFQLEGNDETLQEGIRTISQAVGAMLKPHRLTLSKASNSLPSENHEDLELETNENEEVVENEDDNTSPKSRSQSVRSFRSPEILQLDLNGGTISLKDFCSKKSLGDSDTKRYLVIAAWLKANLDIQAVTIDHIHTCYRHMGWHTPKDAAQPLRDMKNKNGWFSKGTEKGSFILNHVGENEVMKMHEN